MPLLKKRNLLENENQKTQEIEALGAPLLIKKSA